MNMRASQSITEVVSELITVGVIEQPEIVESLRQRMLEWQASHWNALGDSASVSDEIADLLKELGYTE